MSVVSVIFILFSIYLRKALWNIVDFPGIKQMESLKTLMSITFVFSFWYNLIFLYTALFFGDNQSLSAVVVIYFFTFIATGIISLSLSLLKTDGPERNRYVSIFDSIHSIFIVLISSFIL